MHAWLKRYQKRMISGAGLVFCVGRGVWWYGQQRADVQAPMTLEALAPAIITARDLGEQRLTHTMTKRGSFIYAYDPVKNTTPDTNNDIRQLMGSRVLAEMASRDTSYLSLHRKNLDYMFSYLYQESGAVAWIEQSHKSKLGGIAMALRTLVASPDFVLYSGRAEKLAQAILSLQQPEGGFHAWYIAPSYAYDEDYLLTFYSGEAVVALLELYHKTGNKKRRDAAVLAEKRYLQRYVAAIDRWYYPAYVPRHSIALTMLYNETHEQHYLDALFVLNDKLIDELQDVADSSPTRGRFFNPLFAKYGSPHASSDAVYTEGIAYAYGVAQEVGDTLHVQKYQEALVLATKNLLRLQYTDAESEQFAIPAKALGALRTNATNASIRVDTTQHAIDARNQLLVVIGEK